MTLPSASSVIAAIALLMMGGICVALVFHAVPQTNQQLVTFALGAISGALTVGGAGKVADRVTTATGDNTTINAPIKE